MGSQTKVITQPKTAVADLSEFQSINTVPIISPKPPSEESTKMKDLPDAVHTETKTENLLCPKCPKEFDKIKTNPAKWKDMLRCHIGLVHYGKDLADKARSEHDGNKCKACGKISKDNTNKKKHMLFHHTKYVDLVLKEVEHAIKKHYGSDTRQNIKVKPLEKLLKPQEDCNIEQSEATDPKRKMGAETEEINKKAKLDIEVTNDFADVQDLLQSDDEEEGGKEDNQDELHETGGHNKVVNVKREEDEEKERPEEEEKERPEEEEMAEGGVREEEEEMEDKEEREENEEREGGENAEEEKEEEEESAKREENEEEREKEDEEEKEETTDDVMSIQDQLLKMQEFSSDEDDDGEDDRLQEFDGEDPEEDTENSVTETATMEIEEPEADGGEDSGDKLEDILNFPLDEPDNAYEGEDELEEMEDISEDEDTETEDVNLPANLSEKIDQLLGNIL